MIYYLILESCLMFTMYRAFAIRTCLKIGRVEFTDSIITYKELQDSKALTGSSALFPLGSVPVLTLPSGQVVTQSSAIARYAAKLVNLYPLDPLESLFVDEIYDTVTDVLSSAPQDPDQEIKKKKREDWAAGKFKVFLNFFSEKLVAVAGKFIVSGRLTLADIAVYAMLKSIGSGSFDFVPGEILLTWPIFAEYVAFLEADPVFGPHKF